MKLVLVLDAIRTDILLHPCDKYGHNLPNGVEVVPKEVPQTEGRQKTEIEYD